MVQALFGSGDPKLSWVYAAHSPPSLPFQPSAHTGPRASQGHTLLHTAQCQEPQVPVLSLLVIEECCPSFTPSFSCILGDEADHISYPSSLPELPQDKIKWVSQRHVTHFPAFQHFIEDSGSLVCLSMPQIFLWSFIQNQGTSVKHGIT